MTEEQKAERKKSSESGNINVIKKYFLIKDSADAKKQKQDFVFISYKSDDWKEVLDNYVYKACAKYGLRVYFDTAFDEHSDLWINQFYKAMCSGHCRGFVAFLDKKYFTSYACLLELMSSMSGHAGNINRAGTHIPHILLQLEPTGDIRDDDDTGLGISQFEDGQLNVHAADELKQFNDRFNELTTGPYKLQDDICEKMRGIYEPDPSNMTHNYDEPLLNVGQCARLTELIVQAIGNNDNSGNKDFVEVMHAQLPDYVFDDKALERYKEKHDDPELVPVTNVIPAQNAGDTQLLDPIYNGEGKKICDCVQYGDMTVFISDEGADVVCDYGEDGDDGELYPNSRDDLDDFIEGNYFGDDCNYEEVATSLTDGDTGVYRIFQKGDSACDPEYIHKFGLEGFESDIMNRVNNYSA